MSRNPLESFRRWRDAEILLEPPGTGDIRVALIKPSTYHVSMSSLGFQTVYKRLNARGDVTCERAFLPDDLDVWKKSRLPLLTLESESPVGNADLILCSVAYELEVSSLCDMLSLAGLPIRRTARDDRHPLVVVGGPLTFSNPLPLSPLVDVIVMGEGEEALETLLSHLRAGTARADLLDSLATEPGFYVPSHHGERLPGVLKVSDALLPACSAILTPNTELADMFLVEAERGCSRGCTFCVMRRSTNGGMRVVTPEKLLSLLPAQAKRVGLVGAAVTDHPRLPELVRTIVSSGRGLGLSSLRADKLTLELVQLFRQGGYRQLTVASDGASERIRVGLERKIQEKHLLKAAELARDVGMKSLKVYMMLGVPGETEEDIDELIRFTQELARIVPVALGISPFVPKRNTPLDGSPFEEMRVVEQRLKKLSSGIRPGAEVRSTSARWAWVEYRLAQGGWKAGEAMIRAWEEGGAFRAMQRAFVELEGPMPLAPWRLGQPAPPDVLSMPVSMRIKPTVMLSPSALISV